MVIFKILIQERQTGEGNEINGLCQISAPRLLSSTLFLLLVVSSEQWHYLLGHPRPQLFHHLVK